MKLDRYELKAEKQFTTFEFVSEGPKGKIVKAIQFQQTVEANVYNLAFGDLNSLTGRIDDKVVADNGDTEKVLATVVELFIYLLNNTQMPGFMQLEAQPLEQDFTELVSINILTL